jgi:hypothetical protein
MAKSGINIPLDVKGLQPVMVSNGIYILFGCNNSKLEVYHILKNKEKR